MLSLLLLLPLNSSNPMRVHFKGGRLPSSVKNRTVTCLSKQQFEADEQLRTIRADKVQYFRRFRVAPATGDRLHIAK